MSCLCDSETGSDHLYTGSMGSCIHGIGSLCDSKRCQVCTPMTFSLHRLMCGNSIPLKIQPQSMGFLCALCAAQAYYYDRKTPLWKVSACLFGACAIAAGVEVGLVYGARVS